MTDNGPGNEAQARLLSRYGRRFAAGTVLFRDGEPATEAFLLQDGRVRLLKQAGRMERSLRVVRPGDLFGESALIKGASRSSTAIALDDGVALAFDHATFEQVLATSPEVAGRVLNQLIGLIGVIIPLVPTTPMVLLAAFLFSRSSDRLHHWLLRQPVLGPAILDWRRDRAISWKAKAAAAVMVGGGVGASIAIAPLPLWAASLAVVIATTVLAFVLTRPAPGSAMAPSCELPLEPAEPPPCTPDQGAN